MIVSLRGAILSLVTASLLLAGCSRPELVTSSAQELKQEGNIQQLMRARSNDTARVNYVIASGDTVRIRVQQMEELNTEKRVSEQGTIVLPLLGSVPVAGSSERQFAEKLRSELASYIKDPQVTVSVVEIQGSQVSVMGAVARPGVYPVRGLDRTIADLITQAGGMTKDAGTAVYFSPGGSDETASRRQAAAALRLSPQSPGLFAESKQSVAIDLSPMFQGRNVPELSLPVRPGDMIVVASAGEVFVDGWVNNPGALKLTRGMTLTRAISSAGGMHFGAANGKVSLQRKSLSGETKSFGVDYASITSGDTPDVYLENGDRIEVSANPAKSVPWGAFTFMKSILTFGITGNAPTVGAK